MSERHSTVLSTEGCIVPRLREEALPRRPDHGRHLALLDKGAAVDLRELAAVPFVFEDLHRLARVIYANAFVEDESDHRVDGYILGVRRGYGGSYVI